ncbi:MAG: prephenate dehydrogenase/arogenate dehydrogenase family protein [Bryobacterales bacterium]|nr:prephenate dehydrogenase/arogenate dehydrogenase family protein [Bryobacterales bacterium]
MESTPCIRTVAIVGVGLIGGSFALALRRNGFTGRIVGVSSKATLDQARDLEVIDEGCPLEEGVAQADLVYLANPIGRILEQLPRVARVAKPDCLVTDAGSTKQVIVREASRHFAPGLFLGGHPMAGKEARGVVAADARLFEGRPYIVTPDSPGQLERPIVREFLDWIKKLGSLLITLTPESHDERVGRASHLPQMCSSALSEMLGAGGEAPFLAEVAGPGLLDMTRLAMSSHEVWSDIMHTNKTVLLRALDEYIVGLQSVRDRVARGETESLFSDAAKFAKRIRKID